MVSYIEPLMRCVLARELKKHGWIVHREVNLYGSQYKSRPDIIAIQGDFPNVRYIGFEVKSDFPSHEGRTGAGFRQIISQVSRYYQSGFLDEFYIASSEDASLKFKECASSTIVDIDEDSLELKDLAIPDYGVYDIGVNEPYRTRMIKLSPTLRRTAIPKFVNTEADYGQVLWEHFADLGRNPIPEALIADPQSRTRNHADFMIMNGSDDPREIFLSQNNANYYVCALELKCQTTMTDLENQLRRYRDSGCISYLYLAVPNILTRDRTVISTLERIPEVGLYVIDSSSAIEKKSAKRLSLRYDSIKYQGVVELIGRGEKVGKSHSPFYFDEKESLGDFLHALPNDEKHRKRAEIEASVYPSREEATKAIDSIYLMDGTGVAYRRTYDHSSKGWIIRRVAD